MFEYILSDNNLFFTVPLIGVLILSLIEIALGLIGFGSVIFLDVDADIEINPPGIFSKFFLWLQFKDIPFLVLLMLFLFFFGTIGLSLNALFDEIIPLWGIRILSLVLTLPVLFMSGSFLGKYLFRSDSSIVSRNSFIGATAEIILGRASQDYPAEGKVTDPFGKVHYIMIEPHVASQSFEAGEKVLLIRKDTIKYYAINNKD